MFEIYLFVTEIHKPDMIPGEVLFGKNQIIFDAERNKII